MDRNINSHKIVVIAGPTASGKSDLAIKIAQKYNGEIISADSRQVYRGMDIGTGKVSQDKTFPVPNSKFKSQNEKFRYKDFYSEGIKHYLIDVVSPKKQFTASDFKRLGEKAIKEISAKGKLPVVVGGTGFYIDILLGRMNVAQVPPNFKLRAKLEKQSAEQLFKLLRKFYPKRATTIDPHNKRRLIRALEIFQTTKSAKGTKGANNLHHDRVKNYSTHFQILWIGKNPGRKTLAHKIKKRLDERLKLGMIEEIKRLREQKITWKRLDDFGLEYRWISRFLKARNYKPKTATEFKKSEFYKNLLKNIIRYSKRQMTWFTQPHPWDKDNPKNIRWFSSSKEAYRKLPELLKERGWV